MPKSLDPAIIEALNLDPSNTTVALHGGSGFSATAKITTTIDGQENHYFLKTSSDSDAATMFKGRPFSTYLPQSIPVLSVVFVISRSHMAPNMSKLTDPQMLLISREEKPASPSPIG